MVNFGLNSASILGIFLAVAGASLYFMRSVRPELSRDHDIFFAAVGLLCGFILLFQGWRLDPILQFGQFLLTGSAVFFAVESIRLRGVATEQARRNTPTVDRDRPVSRSRVYTEAELDKFDGNEYDDRTPNYNSPRLRGYEEPYSRSSRRPSAARSPEAAYSDPYAESSAEVRSRSRTGRSRSSRPDTVEPPNTRPRRRPASPRSSDVYSDRTDPTADVTYSPRPRTRPITNEDERTTSRPTSRRSRVNPANLGRNYEPENLGRSYDPDSNREYEPENLGRSYDKDLGRNYEPDVDRGYDADLGRNYEDDYDDEVVSTDYVDYQPLEDSESDYSDDLPTNFSDEEESTYYKEGSRPRPNNPIDLDY